MVSLLSTLYQQSLTLPSCHQHRTRNSMALPYNLTDNNLNYTLRYHGKKLRLYGVIVKEIPCLRSSRTTLKHRFAEVFSLFENVGLNGGFRGRLYNTSVRKWMLAVLFKRNNPLNSLKNYSGKYFNLKEDKVIGALCEE